MIDPDEKIRELQQQVRRRTYEAYRTCVERHLAPAIGKKQLRSLTPADVRPYPTTPMYDLGTMRTMFLQFEHEDWEEELAAFNNTDVEVPATLIVDGRTYRDVGVHFRGNSSYRMVPGGDKRSLNLSFDHVHKDQHVGGYRTLNLLNANGDPTFVRTVLYSEIARKYIPAPKVNFVRVSINGESWGVYTNAQQFNKDFGRDFYGTPDGARWKAPPRPCLAWTPWAAAPPTASPPRSPLPRSCAPVPHGVTRRSRERSARSRSSRSPPPCCRSRSSSCTCCGASAGHATERCGRASGTSDRRWASRSASCPAD